MRTSEIIERLTWFQSSSWAYEAIKQKYGKRKAKRSGLPYINHINEGLILLIDMDAGRDVLEAWCLHPIYQDDKALYEQLYSRVPVGKPWNATLHATLMAMEYRAVANAYLSNRKIAHIDEIKLSSITQINMMLIADKLQNYKDFYFHLMWFSGMSAKKRMELNTYFMNWLKKLGIKNINKYWRKIDAVNKALKKVKDADRI